MMPAGRIGSKRSTPADEVDDQNHYRYNEQEMDEPAERVGADHTKQPEHQQNNKDCPEHNCFLGLTLLSFA